MAMLDTNTTLVAMWLARNDSVLEDPEIESSLLAKLLQNQKRQNINPSTLVPPPPPPSISKHAQNQKKFMTLKAMLREVKNGELAEDEVEVYENNRFYPFGGWSSKMFIGDPPSWSDRSGKLNTPKDHKMFELDASKWRSALFPFPLQWRATAR